MSLALRNRSVVVALAFVCAVAVAADSLLTVIPAHEPRDMRRTTLAGDGPTTEQVAA